MQPTSFTTKAEEEQLATWLIERAKRGFRLTVAEFIDSVKRFWTRTTGKHFSRRTGLNGNGSAEKPPGPVRECLPSG